MGIRSVGIRRRRLVRVLLVAVLVAGCGATTGTMTGRLSSPGAPPEQVTLSYLPDRSDDNGSLSLTLPTGESFSGPYVRAGSPAAAAAAPGLDIDFSAVDWGKDADKWTFGQTESDQVLALLQGSRGGKIRCRFTLLYAAGGMRDGGTGQCQVNTGQRIDVKF